MSAREAITISRHVCQFVSLSVCLQATAQTREPIRTISGVRVLLGPVCCAFGLAWSDRLTRPGLMAVWTALVVMASPGGHMARRYGHMA